jgi:hypothetical protein
MVAGIAVEETELGKDPSLGDGRIQQSVNDTLSMGLLTDEPCRQRNIGRLSFKVIVIDDPMLWLKNTEGVQFKTEPWMPSSIEIVRNPSIPASVVARETESRAFVERHRVGETVL